MSTMNLLPRPRSVVSGAGSLALPLASPPDVRVGEGPGLASQGYRLTVAPRGVLIEARDASGGFYARATLDQLARTHARTGALPAMTLEDAPDLPYRGVMLDV